MKKIYLIIFIIVLSMIKISSAGEKKTRTKNLKVTLDLDKNPKPLEKVNECCTKMRHDWFGDCCCKWLIPDYSEFPFKFTSKFDDTGNNALWTCGNSCEFGFKCSKSK